MEPQVKKGKSGFELIGELETLLLELDSVDHEDEDEFDAWLKALEATLDATTDKMLNYRRVMELAKGRQDFFRRERDRYAARFRTQGRVVARVKEFSKMMLDHHHTITGQKRMMMEDGTWASLSIRKGYEFFDAETGENKLDPRKIPSSFVKMEVSKTELKAAAKAGEVIEGVTYRQVEKSHVRWS